MIGFPESIERPAHQVHKRKDEQPAVGYRDQSPTFPSKIHYLCQVKVVVPLDLSPYGFIAGVTKPLVYQSIVKAGKAITEIVTVEPGKPSSMWNGQNQSTTRSQYPVDLTECFCPQRRWQVLQYFHTGDVLKGGIMKWQSFRTSIVYFSIWHSLPRLINCRRVDIDSSKTG
jgi:hypothetical protein